jgi:hypothetical protein
MRKICKNLLIALGRTPERKNEGDMFTQAPKLLDLSALLDYREDKYPILPSLDLVVKGTKSEVRGIAEA